MIVKTLSVYKDNKSLLWKDSVMIRLVILKPTTISLYIRATTKMPTDMNEKYIMIKKGFPFWKDTFIRPCRSNRQNDFWKIDLKDEENNFTYIGDFAEKVQEILELLQHLNC